MTDIELYETLTAIKNDLDLDDAEKHTAMRAVMDEVKDRLCAINVGDEIIRTSINERQVVTCIKNSGCFLAIKPDGDTMSHYYEKIDLIKGNVVKTGKNYPQIAEVLAELQN